MDKHLTVFAINLQPNQIGACSQTIDKLAVNFRFRQSSCTYVELTLITPTTGLNFECEDVYTVQSASQHHKGGKDMCPPVVILKIFNINQSIRINGSSLFVFC